MSRPRGAIAQLGERLDRTQEVVGSSPTSSIARYCEAMSQKIETLRAFVEAFNRKDFDDLVRYLHPEVEIYPAIGGELDVSRRYRGRDEVRQLLETITEGVEPHVEIEAAIEAEEGRVLLIEHWSPRSSLGVETPFELSTIYSFQDDLVVRVEGFREPAEARAAAGLME
jgi:limonene-1,2-epoxide hydrolase